MIKMKNVLKAAATGSFTLLLAACYGIAYTMQTKTGRVTILDPTETPIPDIELTLIKNQDSVVASMTTDEQGQADWEMDIFSSYQLKIEDADGPENGGPYATEIITIENDTATDYSKIITLEE
ncbi:MAG: hypothetical protein JEY99_04890 [Spirochaetales bacterium]|nr:hypothetical protein [Spirochaetales bacterium]